MSVFRWVGKRTKCLIHGHKMTHSKIFYPPAKSVVPGYCCERCAKTQPLLYRWQEVSE